MGLYVPEPGAPGVWAGLVKTERRNDVLPNYGSIQIHADPCALGKLEPKEQAPALETCAKTCEKHMKTLERSSAGRGNWVPKTPFSPGPGESHSALQID